MHCGWSVLGYFCGSGLDWCVLLFFAYLFPFVLFSFRFLSDVAEISFCVCILGGVLIVCLVVFLLQADLAAFGLIVVG